MLTKINDDIRRHWVIMILNNVPWEINIKTQSQIEMLQYAALDLATCEGP